MNYHSARFYAPWLGRWTSSDPAGLVDGVGRYSYVNGRPGRFRDGAGLSGETAIDDPPAVPFVGPARPHAASSGAYAQSIEGWQDARHLDVVDSLIDDVEAMRPELDALADEFGIDPFEIAMVYYRENYSYRSWETIGQDYNLGFVTGIPSYFALWVYERAGWAKDDLFAPTTHSAQWSHGPMQMETRLAAELLHGDRWGAVVERAWELEGSINEARANPAAVDRSAYAADIDEYMAVRKEYLGLKSEADVALEALPTALRLVATRMSNLRREYPGSTWQMLELDYARGTHLSRDPVRQMSPPSKAMEAVQIVRSAESELRHALGQ